MKKKFLTLCLMFVFMFIININTVKGLTTCEYGIKESDDADWESKVSLIVSDYDSVGLNAKESQIYHEIKSSDGYQDVHKGDGNYIYLYHRDNGSGLDEDDIYYIYAILYPTPDSYEVVNGACPKTLNYSFTHKKGDNDSFTMAMYVDELAEDKIVYWDTQGKWSKQQKSLDAAKEFGFSEESGVMILKEYKDTKLNEIVDVYSCYTYSSYFQAMVKAKNAKGGNCDGNKEFTKYFTELQDLCTAYRSSELYADSNGAVSSGCQTACTNLKDDVAELCPYDNDSGYCGSVSSDVMAYIFKLFGIARYIVPALLVILSIIDYIKAIASESEDEMKKVSGRFVKRMLAAALVILVPLVIDFILGLFDIPGLSADKPFCNK